MFRYFIVIFIGWNPSCCTLLEYHSETGIFTEIFGERENKRKKERIERIGLGG